LYWLKDNQTALHVASRVGDVATVDLLISRGAAVDAVTSDLYSPLHIAAKEGHDDLAHLLLERGVASSPTTKARLLRDDSSTTALCRITFEKYSGD